MTTIRDKQINDYEHFDAKIQNELKLKKETALILNLACGKMSPQFNYNFEYFLLNVDKNTMVSDDVRTIMDMISMISNNRRTSFADNTATLEYDAYEFLQQFPFEFDIVCIYRFLEHISKTNILFFLYLLSTVVREGGLVDIIVPNYEILASKILNENVNSNDFEQEDIITTFELLNEPYDPHASIWTPQRARYYMEFEKRFKIISMENNYIFDGRDLYIRFLAKRVNPLFS